MERGKRRRRWQLRGWVLLAALGPVSAPAATGGPFHGRFRCGNAQLVLQQDVDLVEGVFVADKVRFPLRGRVAGGVLQAAVVSPTGDQLDFKATASEAGLTVRMQDGEEELFARQPSRGAKRELLSEKLKRQPERAPRRAPAGAVERKGPPEPKGARQPAEPTPPGGEARGPLYRVEHEGWGFRAPRGWTYEQKGANVVLTSKTEAGVLLISAARHVDRETLGLAMRQELAAVGVFPSLPPLRRLRLPQATAWLAEVQGVSDAGAPLWARAVGVLSGSLSVMVVGLTEPSSTVDRVDLMRERIDRVARSVHFFAPLISPARRSVVGEWWLDSSGASATASRSAASVLALCADGRFFASHLVPGAGRGPDGGQPARWHVTGDSREGVVTVTYVSGQVLHLPFRADAEGAGLLFAGHLYISSGTSRWCD